MAPRYSHLLFLSLSAILLLLPSVIAVPAHIAAAASASASSDFLPWRGEVLNLGDGDFAENLRGREIVVNFFAPWCSACKQFKPVYESWASSLSTHAEVRLRRIAVAKVDCTLNPQTSSARQIAAFPTLHFYRDGVLISEYHGERAAKDLDAWVRTHAKQSSPEEEAAAAAQIQQQQQQRQQQQQQQHQPPPRSSSSSFASSLLSDFDPLSPASWSDLPALRRLLDRLLEFPLVVFREHPYMALAILYTIGVFQGLFVGIIWALREKR